MIIPPELREIEFTFRCRIATYDRESLAKSHTLISDTLKNRLRELIGYHGVVSSEESRMEQL